MGSCGHNCAAIGRSWCDLQRRCQHGPVTCMLHAPSGVAATVVCVLWQLRAVSALQTACDCLR
jgi:hypothetical protein